PEPFPASSSSQHSAANLRRPRSFPTRRSSDLENYGGEEFLAGFPQNILDIPVVGGEQIGMAYSLSVPVVYYNADLMREAGLDPRSEEHTSELQSRENLVCRLLLEKKNYTGSTR